MKKDNDKFYDKDEAEKHKHWMDKMRRREDCNGKLLEMRWPTYTGKKERRTDGFVTYNAAHMSYGRSCKISNCFEGKTVAIQGTKRRGEKDVVIQENTNNHAIFHLTHGSKRAQDSAGVAVMLPKEDKALIHTVGYSNDTKLRGRVGYVRIKKRNKVDITFITVYIPVESTDRELTGRIWDWVEEVINKVNGQSNVVIGTDANGHTKSMEEEDTEALQVIGPNDWDNWSIWNGDRMCSAMQKHGMIAVNTHWKEACGPSYFTKRESKEKTIRSITS